MHTYCTDVGRRLNSLKKSIMVKSRSPVQNVGRMQNKRVGRLDYMVVVVESDRVSSATTATGLAKDNAAPGRPAGRLRRRCR